MKPQRIIIQIRKKDQLIPRTIAILATEEYEDELAVGEAVEQIVEDYLTEG